MPILIGIVLLVSLPIAVGCFMNGLPFLGVLMLIQAGGTIICFIQIGKEIQRKALERAGQATEEREGEN